MLDLTRVTDYNTSIDVVKGGQKIIDTEAAILAVRVKSQEKSIRTMLNIREGQFRDALAASPLGQTGLDNPDAFLDYFIINPNGINRMDEVISLIRKTDDPSELEEIRKQFSDIIIDAISKRTPATGKEGIVDTAGGAFAYDFDVDVFARLLNNNKDNLEHIVGKEHYASMKRMSDFLRVVNRDERDIISESGVSILVPRGLSIESLLSRTYAIFRGVISPKYVATEVALLGVRKKKAHLLATILNDPKSIDAVLEILENGPEGIKRFNSRFYDILINALAQHERDTKKEKSEGELNKLGLDKFKMN